MEKIPCFLCGNDLQVRTDKNEKLYFICNECGVQAFIRRALGIKRLKNLVRRFQEQNFQFATHQHSFLEICAVLQEIDSLQREIKKAKKNPWGYFLPTPTKSAPSRR